MNHEENKLVTIFLVALTVAIVIMSLLLVYIVYIKPRTIVVQVSSPGDKGKDYLKNDIYTYLLIEIDYVPGYAPDNDALSLLIQRITFYTNKTIKDKVLNAELENRDKYTIEEVYELEKKHRNYYTANDVAVLYFIYLSGEFADEKNVLGVAYTGTSIVVFKETIKKAATVYLPVRDIESAVLVHEFGHIIGLVNINYKSDRNHEDTAHKYHCINPKCVMYYEVESRKLSIIFTGLPTDFDDNCRKDIEKLKSS